MAPMAPFWGFLGAALALLLFSGMGLASWQRRRRPGTGWWHAFGFVMAEAGAAVGITSALHAVRYDLIAPFYRRGNEVGDILESFRRAWEMLAYFQVTLAVAFLLLAMFGALPRPASKID